MALKPVLVKYIEETYYPIYDTFDGGHDSRHAKAVAERAFQIAGYIDEMIDWDVLYTAAALHDIGMSVSREEHPKHSGEIIRSDENLLNMLGSVGLELAARAAEDHSTSCQGTPRGIYGKIVSDADKDNDMDTSLMRTYEYVEKNFPEYDEHQRYDAVYTHLCSKFGESGLVHLWYTTPVHTGFIEQMRNLANDKNKLDAAMDSALEKRREG